MEETVFYGVTNGLWMHLCDIFRLLKSRTNNWTLVFSILCFSVKHVFLVSYG